MRRAQSPFIVGLVSAPFVDGDLSHNLTVVTNAIAQNADRGIDLLCFGEAFLQGFDALTWKPEVDFALALDSHSDAFRTLRKAAKREGLGVCFGYFERTEDGIFSSQAVISNEGQVVHNFRRVSTGWRVPTAGGFYREGPGFDLFRFRNKSIAIALCGDLWQEEYVARIRELNADVVLWPVYVDFTVERWNAEERLAYAAQAAKLGTDVLFVNSIAEGADRANGGAAHFRDGEIVSELPCGEPGVLVVRV